MESVSVFPFRMLRQENYLTLEVLMFVKHLDAINFMFALNKSARGFIQDNYVTVRNGFVNEGLIEYELDCK